MDLIFLVLAHGVLCFGFVTKCWKHTSVMAVAEQYLHSIKASSFSSTLSLTVSKLGVGKKLDGTQLRQLTQINQRDISMPYKVILNNKN